MCGHGTNLVHDSRFYGVITSLRFCPYVQDPLCPVCVGLSARVCTATSTLLQLWSEVTRNYYDCATSDLAVAASTAISTTTTAAAATTTGPIPAPYLAQQLLFAFLLCKCGGGGTGAAAAAGAGAGAAGAAAGAGAGACVGAGAPAGTVDMMGAQQHAELLHWSGVLAHILKCHCCPQSFVPGGAGLCCPQQSFVPGGAGGGDAASTVTRSDDAAPGSSVCGGSCKVAGCDAARAVLQHVFSCQVCRQVYSSAIQLVAVV